jgi:predicted nuclease of predicted toxin-antitoxin system
VKRLKFLLDEDTPSKCAIALRKRGIDVIHIDEVSRKGLSDEEQLDFAISEQRCIVSFNIAHFVDLYSKCINLEKIHYGIIVNKHITLNELYYRLIAYYDKYSSDDLMNNILFLN